jgi:RNA polymerase sigma factor (sigma-70 family)
LVGRCRAGDPDAWRGLLPAFQEIGRRTLRSFRLSAVDVDEILADALTALYAGGLSRFRGDSAAEAVAFLRAIVRNRALDLVKQRARWTVTDPTTPAYAAAVAPVGGGAPGDLADELADDECVEFLRQELGALKREDRELYLMKARGLREREIAEQTGRPAGTVASQIARLLERLRGRLRERGCL